MKDTITLPQSSFFDAIGSLVENFAKTVVAWLRMVSMGFGGGLAANYFARVAENAQPTWTIMGVVVGILYGLLVYEYDNITLSSGSGSALAKNEAEGDSPAVGA